MIAIRDIAWVAGILEGEGSFGLTNNKRTPCIWLSMTDADIVERIRVLIDPSKTIHIHEDQRKESYKPIYRLTLNGTRAIQWMMTIYSLMSIRRKAKIGEVLNIWKLVTLDESQLRTSNQKQRQGLAFRLRRKGYSDNQIEIAKVFKARGLSDDQILVKLEELKTTGIH